MTGLTKVAMTNAQVVKAYMTFRAQKEAFHRKAEEIEAELQAKMDRLSAHLLDVMNKSGLDGFRTAYGLVYTQEDMIPRADDWDAVYTFIQETGAWDMLERRIKKTFVQTYMDEHDKEAPPGVSVLRKKVARVRKLTARKEAPEDGE